MAETKQPAPGPPVSDSSATPSEQAVNRELSDLPGNQAHEAVVDAESQYVTGIKLATIIATLILACFLMLIDTMVISTAIPRITDEFKSLTDVGWYAGAYQFGSAAPQPLAGKVYTHFKLKWSFLTFFGLFELGSVLCGAATSSAMLIVGRAIAGLGAAGIINGSIVIISACAPIEKSPGLIGTTVGFAQLGLVIGPLIGGAFTSYSTWRWSFYINLPIGFVVALVIVMVRIPEQTPKAAALKVISKLHHHLDLAGFLLFAPAILQLLLALQYGGNQYAWNSSQVIGLFVGFASTLTVWSFWNYRKGDDGLLPVSLLRRKLVWTAGTFQAFFLAAIQGSIYYLPVYFQTINNAPAILSGVYLLPMILPQLVGAASLGVALKNVGYVIPLALVSTILLSTGCGLYSLLEPGSPTGWWVGFQIIGGFGSGLGLNLTIAAVQACVTRQEVSSAVSFLIFTQSLGPSIFLVLSNVILLQGLKTQIPRHAPDVNPEAIIRAGATHFRAIVSTEDLPQVLVAYSNSISRVFYFIAAIAATCSIWLWGLGWTDLRPKKMQTPTNDGKAEREK
ncbi:major facilitator superfamily domain-containing protein [Xylaria palmicola]|nr:major facilitator superfamily domain-containing protein [Xylaria palmicola]